MIFCERFSYMFSEEFYIVFLFRNVLFSRFVKEYATEGIQIHCFHVSMLIFDLVSE